MSDFLDEIDAQMALVFAFDADGGVRVHVFGEHEKIDVIKLVAMANEALDGFRALLPKKGTIGPPSGG